MYLNTTKPTQNLHETYTCLKSVLKVSENVSYLCPIYFLNFLKVLENLFKLQTIEMVIDSPYLWIS